MLIKNFSMLRLAQEVFYESSQKQDTLIISIQEPNGNGFIFTPTKRVKGVLTLEFEDMDTFKYSNLKKAELKRYKLFTEEHAMQIKEFIDFYKEDMSIKRIFIHCHAGVSRSGAVKAVLDMYYGNQFKEDDLLVINYRVLQILSKTFGLSCDYLINSYRESFRIMHKNRDIKVEDI